MFTRGRDSGEGRLDDYLFIFFQQTAAAPGLSVMSETTAELLPNVNFHKSVDTIESVCSQNNNKGTVHYYYCQVTLGQS